MWHSLSCGSECVYIFIYVYVIVSSPYLLVFGNDRVCGTQEQMMLQVGLVRRRVGAWVSWEIIFTVLLFYEF